MKAKNNLFFKLRVIGMAFVFAFMNMGFGTLLTQAKQNEEPVQEEQIQEDSEEDDENQDEACCQRLQINQTHVCPNSLRPILAFVPAYVPACVVPACVAPAFFGHCRQPGSAVQPDAVPGRPERRRRQHRQLPMRDGGAHPRRVRG